MLEYGNVTITPGNVTIPIKLVTIALGNVTITIKLVTITPENFVGLVENLRFLWISLENTTSDRLMRWFFRFWNKYGTILSVSFYLFLKNPLRHTKRRPLNRESACVDY